MLVLTRSLGEEIVIADNIRVKVIGLRNRHVRLGIIAPASVTVDREEIHRRRNEFRDMRVTAMPSSKKVRS
jgi:carbon storage regulator